jgi:hypothetical protein
MGEVQRGVFCFCGRAKGGRDVRGYGSWEISSAEGDIERGRQSNGPNPLNPTKCEAENPAELTLGER